jgi:GATA-binding protein
MQLSSKSHETSSQRSNQNETKPHRKSSANQPSIAESLLSTTLFPPRKPKSRMVYDDSFDSDNDDDDSDGSDKNPVKKDPLASQVWRMYTKAKDNLPNGSRLENLTWRMMAMTLKKKERAESASSSPKEAIEETPRLRHASQPPLSNNYHAMAVDNEPMDSRKGNNVFYQNEAVVQSQYCGATGTDPPESDDTTALLSSSAPPYMFDFLNDSTNMDDRRPSQADSGNSNTLVSGSTRALLPGKSTGAMSNRGGLHQHMVKV